jgi:hypothetical protein
MTDVSILRKEKVGAQLAKITLKAVNDGATPDEIFEALKIVFSFWIGHLGKNDREGAIRTLEQHLPQMLEQANRYAALAEQHGDLQ